MGEYRHADGELLPDPPRCPHCDRFLAPMSSDLPSPMHCPICDAVTDEHKPPRTDRMDD